MLVVHVHVHVKPGDVEAFLAFLAVVPGDDSVT